MKDLFGLFDLVHIYQEKHIPQRYSYSKTRLSTSRTRESSHRQEIHRPAKSGHLGVFQDPLDSDNEQLLLCDPSAGILQRDYDHLTM
jgi:hypothetical protein